MLAFYKGLLGERASSLSGVDVAVIKKGKVLRHDQRIQMIRGITVSKVDIALKGIHQDFAPSVDGMTSLFFNLIWNLFKTDIYI